ncbi:formate dehydrogenase subunit delta [Microvirga sp. ACRRW]|uniref:formate dehydrogenase subunit delta n=1 Tax=Microvirga sp. ACRRW TaxID=2918205 RepID=UPI001EF4ED48|nr:formate dehydrogenase subunit delta [Microvirga sp. ACRRW]MCG7393820.1 formate dehydrogenase subunit delta [Microvirga sp. ACRRW]
MANQIASFFRSYPEEQAIKGIHDHLVAFWTPGMRRDLLSYASQGGGKLDPLVVKAVSDPQTGKNPIKKAISGPEVVGDLASDAG